MTKPIKPLSEQIKEYKLQFELYQELKQWKIDNPEPIHTRLSTDKSDMNAVLRFPTYQKKHEEWNKNLNIPFRQSLRDRGYKFVEWNWDESWDGQLIKDVTALEKAGFTIVSFSRKRKVTLKPSSEMENRGDIIKYVSMAVGDSWYSISFKPTLSIYWKGRSSNYRY